MATFKNGKETGDGSKGENAASSKGRIQKDQAKFGPGGQTGELEFQQACTDLRSGDYNAREAAADRLGSLNDRRAVPFLVAATSDECPIVVEAALEALAKINSPEAIPAFVSSLDNPCAEIREIGYAALIRGKIVDIDVLKKGLKDADGTIQAMVANAMLGFGVDPSGLDLDEKTVIVRECGFSQEMARSFVADAFLNGTLEQKKGAVAYLAKAGKDVESDTGRSNEFIDVFFEAAGKYPELLPLIGKPDGDAILSVVGINNPLDVLGAAPGDDKCTSDARIGAMRTILLFDGYAHADSIFSQLSDPDSRVVEEAKKILAEMLICYDPRGSAAWDSIMDYIGKRIDSPDMDSAITYYSNHRTSWGASDDPELEMDEKEDPFYSDYGHMDDTSLLRAALEEQGSQLSPEQREYLLDCFDHEEWGDSLLLVLNNPSD